MSSYTAFRTEIGFTRGTELRQIAALFFGFLTVVELNGELVAAVKYLRVKS